MERRSISIWFFIGILLDIYGILILGAGIYGALNPQQYSVEMAHLHAGIWWGALLLTLGLIYTIKFRWKKGRGA